VWVKTLEMSKEGHFRVKNYNIRHIEDIRTLWREQYSEDHIVRREELLKWICEKNPFLKDDSAYFLLCASDRVMGMCGFMPVEFSIAGRRKVGRFAHDVLFCKDCRGKGFFNTILQGTVEQVGSFVAGLWPNENMLKSCLKNGWLNVPECYSYVKVFDPVYFLKGRIKNSVLLKIIAPLTAFFLTIRQMFLSVGTVNDIEILEIEKFDDRFDAFFESLSKNLGITVVRTKAYLNWKFVEKPFNNYLRYAAFNKDGELLGYMVTKKENLGDATRGKIIDILAYPERSDVFRTLVDKAVKECTTFKATYLGIFCTLPVFQKELRKLGFFRSKTPERLMLYNWEKELEGGFISDSANWYLTYSDSDGDAWEVDF
jgi:hypothetical protein